MTILNLTTWYAYVSKHLTINIYFDIHEIYIFNVHQIILRLTTAAQSGETKEGCVRLPETLIWTVYYENEFDQGASSKTDSR